MNEHLLSLIDTLTETHSLSPGQYRELIDSRCPEAAALLADRAVAVRKAIYGNDVYVRGLIEISNICKNDCLYCGIRRSNKSCDRYRLTREQIMECADEGYRLGFRTFVLQGGEDPYYTDELLGGTVEAVKAKYPDCAVTLSVGERERDVYQSFFDAGADRYLLRHETADAAQYRVLHPPSLSLAHRMDCLRQLKEIGFQVGAGFLVGAPGQTDETLAENLLFLQEFRPHMVGIGPFLPHHETPFAAEPPGSTAQTLFLLSCIRLMLPQALLPATTALGTAAADGRERGILAGANVVMPNLSPAAVREQYMLYDNKLSSGGESAQGLDRLRSRLGAIGYEIDPGRGDSPLARSTNR